MCAPFGIANWLRLDDENIGEVVRVLSEPIVASCSEFGIALHRAIYCYQRVRRDD